MSNKYFSKSNPTAAVSVKDDNVCYAAVQNSISTIKDYTKCFIDWIERDSNESLYGGYVSDPKNLNIISKDISVPPCYKVLAETYIKDADKGIVRGNKHRVVYPLREQDIQQLKDGLINKALTHIDIPYGTKTIGNSKFYGQKLQSIYIPDSVTIIGAIAFRNCSSLTSIYIPDSVTIIGVGAFRNCKNLTSINIPNSVTSIDGTAFSGCSSLTSIELPDSLTRIGDSAFSYCINLTSINIPNNVTSINRYTFTGCHSLTSINLPDSVTSIGYRAFGDCSGLTSIKLPDSLTSIENNAFNNCDNLTTIKYLSETPPELGEAVFINTHNDLKIYVPDASVDKYKTATNWKEYADKIRPLSEAPNE